MGCNLRRVRWRQERLSRLHKEEGGDQTLENSSCGSIPKGRADPAKARRDSDRREKLAERRLSAERSEARAAGKQPGPRPQAEPVSRPASEKETSRLMAKHEVAGERLAHLIRTDAPDKEVKSAARTFSELGAALERTRAARQEMGRERMPQVVYTTEEWRQLKEYRTSRNVPTKDNQAAARVQAGRIIAGTELKDAQGRAEAFQHTRHFWKFDVEGWDQQLSLREIEGAIQSKSAERLKLHNFLRPSRREAIQGQIDYLHEVKADIQKQLAVRERIVHKDLGAAQVRYDTAAKQAENVART